MNTRAMTPNYIHLEEAEPGPNTHWKGSVALRCIAIVGVSVLLLVGAVFIISSPLFRGTSARASAGAPSALAVAPLSLNIPGHADSCPTCRQAETLLSCRACANSFSIPQFCGACQSQGLNDIGCRGCPDIAATALTQTGSDRDAHGCLPSAGYRWCKAMSKCIRPWEEHVHSESDFVGKCTKSTPSVLVGSDKDSHGCLPSAGYRWCKAMSKCIRPWEENMKSESDFVGKCTKSTPSFLVGSDTDSHGCLPSAGYRWCGAMYKCIRAWEVGLTTEKSFVDKCFIPAQSHKCSCPPSEVIYPCTQKEYDAIMSGHKCPFYRRRASAALRR